MAKVTQVTLYVWPDEPCIILREEHKRAPDSQSIRRYRTLVVVRGDAPAEYVEDMGLASEFGDEFRILGCDISEIAEGGRFYPVETVGSMLDIAEGMRQTPFDIESIVREDLIGGYHDFGEQVRRVRAGETP